MAFQGKQVIAQVTGSLPTGGNTIGNVGLALGGSGSGLASASTMPDGDTGAAALRAGLGLFNDATWDRWRNNTEGTLLASAARTASIQSADQTNYNGRGLFIHIKVTAVTATPSITVAIEGKNAAGVYFNLLTSAAITGVGDYLLIVAPWAAETANVSTAKMVPRTWRVNVTAADADEITYGVYYNLGV